MKINTKATNIELTPAIKEYIEKKITMLGKFIRDTDAVLINVEVGKTTKHHKSGDFFKAEIHLMENGKNHYAVVETDDLYAAIDEVKDEIVREMTSSRKKALHLWRQSGAMLKNLMRGLDDFGRSNWKKIRGKK